jgi:hypothetical protein
MDIKFVIFVFISAFLMAAIYSSFAFVQFAFSENSCAFTPDKKRYICIGAYYDKNYIINCTVDSIAEWYCDTHYLTREFSLPDGLKDALDKAKLAEIQANTTGDNDTKVFDRLNDRAMNELSIDSNDSNDTKVPNDFDLNKGGILTKDSQITTEDNQITTNEESSPTPPPCPDKGPIPPDCTMKPLLK